MKDWEFEQDNRDNGDEFRGNKRKDKFPKWKEKSHKWRERGNDKRDRQRFEQGGW